MIEVALETSCRSASVALRVGESADDVELERAPIEAVGALGVLEEVFGRPPGSTIRDEVDEEIEVVDLEEDEEEDEEDVQEAALDRSA